MSKKSVIITSVYIYKRIKCSFLMIFFICFKQITSLIVILTIFITNVMEIYITQSGQHALPYRLRDSMTLLQSGVLFYVQDGVKKKSDETIIDVLSMYSQKECNKLWLLENTWNSNIRIFFLRRLVLENKTFVCFVIRVYRIGYFYVRYSEEEMI